MKNFLTILIVFILLGFNGFGQENENKKYWFKMDYAADELFKNLKYMYIRYEENYLISKIQIMKNFNFQIYYIIAGI